MSELLKVEHLKTQFITERGLVKAVNDISYHIDEGEIIGLVGESGCGKSVSQLSIMQLIPFPPGEITGGKVMFQGKDILQYERNSPEMRAIRGGQISMIFQEPMTSLNPAITVANQMSQVMRIHLGIDATEARRKGIKLLQMVGIPDAEGRVDDYPHQFSGGMRQRVMVAMAVSCNPKLIIADEPTTALDATIQAQLLELLKDVVGKLNTAMVMVTHNLGIVARYARRINVMYAGRIVETGTVKEIWDNPRHPYTISLLKCVPKLGQQLVPIEGLPPHLINMSQTCAFYPRCVYGTDACKTNISPDLAHVDGEHFVACHIDTSGLKNEFDMTGLDEAAVLNRGTISNETILDVRRLKKYFPITRGLLRRKVADVKAIDDISFTIKKGETFGLVGESGCGKTTVGRCLQHLYPSTSGDIIFRNQNISELNGSTKKQILHRKISFIFQDPHGSLNPRMKAETIVGEPIRVHHLAGSKREYQDMLDELFLMAGLDPSMKDRFPHEFSGGQRQRLAIARALAGDPSLIICDEPISALDVSIQAQIINLLIDLQKQKEGLTYLFISHDLLAVQYLSTRVAVMYLGRIVEIADSKELYQNTLHPYAKALLSAIPLPDPYMEEKRERVILQGDVPSPLNPPSGCHFHTRCPNAISDCRKVVPELRDMGKGHYAACLLV